MHVYRGTYTFAYTCADSQCPSLYDVYGYDVYGVNYMTNNMWSPFHDIYGVLHYICDVHSMTYMASLTI